MKTWLLVFCVVGATAPVSGYTLWTLKWTNPAGPTLYINPTNYRGLPVDAVEADLLFAANLWKNVGTRYTYTYAGRTTGTTMASDGRSTVAFRDALNPIGSSIIASTGCWMIGGVLWDCDVIYWRKPFFVGTTGCTLGAGFYIRDIGAHEMGHMATLLHSTVYTATMYPRAGRCSLRMTTLDPDDTAALKAQYP